MNKKNTFLSATVAGALVATAIAAPVSATTTFTDVSDRYKEAVNYLVKNNVTQGITKDKFGTEAQITRVDAAVMIAKELKLNTQNTKPSGFTDVPKRAQGAVNALKEKGIINGKTDKRFGSDDKITRGEMAIILQRAYNLNGDQKIAFKDVGKRYTDPVKALVTHNITNGISKDKFGTNEPIKRGDFAIFLYKSATLDKKPVKPGAPQSQGVITQVLLNSPYETEIKFSVPLKKSSAIKKDNYKVNGLVPDYVYLKDSKTVVLQFAQGNKNSLETDGAKYEVKSIETTTPNVKTAPYSSNYEYKDVQAPVILFAEYVNGKINVHFNELLKEKPEKILVNGKEIPSENYRMNPEAKKQLVIDYEPTNSNKANIVLVNVTDTAKKPNVVEKLQTTVSVPTSVTEAVDIKIDALDVLNHEEILVRFNTNIKEETFKAVLQYKDEEHEVVFNRGDLSNVYKAKIPAKALGTADKRYFDLYILKDTISAGTKKNKELSQSLKVERDTTPPAYVSHDYNIEGNRTLLTITYDKDIKTLQRENNGIVVIDDKGVPQEIVEVVYSKHTLKILMKDKLSEGAYKVTVPKGFVRDKFENQASKIVTTFDIRKKEDTTPPTVERVEVQKPTALGKPFKYLITYSEPVTDLAVTKSSYKIDNKPLPAAATAVFNNENDPRIVEITFNEGSYNIGDALQGAGATLSIENIKDLAGNQMAETFQHAVRVFDNTPAKPSNLEVNSKEKRIVLTFDEQLKLTDSSVGISSVFKAKGAKLQSFSFDSEVPNKVIITFAEVTGNAFELETLENQTYLLDMNGYPVKFKGSIEIE